MRVSDNFGIVKYDEIEDYWLGVDTGADFSIRENPLMTKDEFFDKHLGASELTLFQNPEYIGATVYYLTGLKLAPFQMVIQHQLWKHSFPMLIASRGASKSFSMGLFSVLACTLVPGYQVVIAGASFRQSKQIFEYAERIWLNSPVLRSMRKKTIENPFSRGNDKWTFRINDGTITAIPIGDGERIRGLRANAVICVGGDTMIETDRGVMTAKEIYDSGDLSIKFWDGSQFQKNSRLINLQKRAIRVKTKYGYELVGGETHRVMTDKGWKQLNELSLKDRVIIEAPPIPEKGYNGRDWARFLGYFISEGSNNKMNITFVNTKGEVLDDIRRTIDNLGLPRREYTRPAHIDERGWNCKESTQIIVNKSAMPKDIRAFFLQRKKSWEKITPDVIWKANRQTVREYLRALFEGDGSVGILVQNRYGKTTQDVRVKYYTTSKQLAYETRYLLLKFGIMCGVSIKWTKGGINKRLQYMLYMYGANSIKFMDEIGFTCTEPDLTEVKKARRFKIKSDVPVLAIDHLGEEDLYDFTIENTHRYLSNGFMSHNCDEFHAHNPDIIEEILFGFGAVASNPTEKVILEAKRERARKLGYNFDGIEIESNSLIGMKNKSIICGTAGYYFNHFYEYWLRYKKIIESKGDTRKLEEIFNGEIPESFDWKEFCVMRIPYSVLPKGFMEAETVARAKSQMSKSLYEKEYEAIFVEDSDGFFKRSSIERCVAKESNVFRKTWVPYCPAPFDAVIEGNTESTYVFGVDPAAKQDNFAIVILEVFPDHQRVVYCWVTNEEDFLKRKKEGFTKLDNYYVFCAQKIRELLRVFPSRVVAVDALGGGQALFEALGSKMGLQEGELPILKHIDYKDPSPTDTQEGSHIVYPVQFVRADWTHEANWGLKGDLENRRLLFPNWDEVTIDLCIAQDDIRMERFRLESGGVRELILVDSLTNCVDNIEELKDELTNITYTVTKHGREQWNVPDIKVDRSTLAKGRKDRYSALLMANYFAREARSKVEKTYMFETTGGLVRDLQTMNGDILYKGAPWYDVNW